MSCCGQKRAALRRGATFVTSYSQPVGSEPQEHTMTLRYTGTTSILINGARSGRTYLFSTESPKGTVFSDDAPALFSTGLFTAES